jgi:Flp pilus assembly protein TadD
VAIKEFHSAIQADLNYASAYNNLGVELAYVGEFDGAAAAFERALEIKPAFAAARFNLGMLYVRLNRPDAALVQTKLLSEIDKGFGRQLYTQIYRGKILNVRSP